MNAYSGTSQMGYDQGFQFQPGLQQPFTFSPNTQSALALGPAPSLDPFGGQLTFDGQLNGDTFQWPLDLDPNFQFDAGSHALPPAPYLPAPLPPAPAPPLAAAPTAQRFHPYGHSRSTGQSLPTPPGRPSPAESTPKAPVPYPEAGTPLTVLPSPAPTIPEKPAPPPARPRPSTRLRRTNSSPSVKLSGKETPSKLDSLFSFLDAQDWSISEMLVALSEMPTDEVGSDLRSTEHVRRMADFLHRESRVGAKGSTPDGPEEIARRWKEREADGGGSDKALENAVNGLYQRMGASHGSAIRNILTRDGVPYEESPTDIQMLDATLSRPPSPRSLKARDRTVAPQNSATVFTGRIVIPSTQADILGHWLMAPGRPALADEKDSITPEHMRIYSSLAPLELHARGAELCRVILMRDQNIFTQFGHLINVLERLIVGPIIPPSRRCAFHEYDDYSLWHHSLMAYLQLCTRYPNFRESKEAAISIAPDVSTLPASALEATLIERALQSHWESFRLYLMEEGGLLRSAVRAFAGVGARTRPMDLMLICDDTQVVLKALKKSLKEPSERILPYDPAVSEARNQWRQASFWAENSHFVGWHAATSHFLEISNLFPRFSEGVRELPGLEKLLGGT